APSPLGRAQRESRTFCDWTMKPDGRVLHDPKNGNGRAPTLASLGLGRALAVTRARMPKGDRQVLLTLRSNGPTVRDLRATVVGSTGNVERSIVLVAEPFASGMDALKPKTALQLRDQASFSLTPTAEGEAATTVVTSTCP